MLLLSGKNKEQFMKLFLAILLTSIGFTSAAIANECPPGFHWAPGGGLDGHCARNRRTEVEHTDSDNRQSKQFPKTSIFGVISDKEFRQ
jgi:hypothetical protein